MRQSPSTTAAVALRVPSVGLAHGLHRGGPRRHIELDQSVTELIDDGGIDRLLRARAAAIIAEVSFGVRLSTTAGNNFWTSPRDSRRSRERLVLRIP